MTIFYQLPLVCSLSNSSSHDSFLRLPRESAAKPRMMESKNVNVASIDRKEVLHSIRTAAVAIGSLLIARLCGLPESYWAAVTTIVIMQSTLGAAWTVSKFAGTALGAAMGALLTAYAAQNVAAFWCRRICTRTDLRTAAHWAKRLPVRRDYASHRHADSAYRARMDDRHQSVPRNFLGNRGRIAPDRLLAGAWACGSLNPTT
jgi:hypothetical protein